MSGKAAMILDFVSTGWRLAQAGTQGSVTSAIQPDQTRNRDKQGFHRVQHSAFGESLRSCGFE